MILIPQFWAVLKKISNNLPLEPTHKRRPAREFMDQEQHSQLQANLLEAIFSSKWWNVKFLRITALKQTA